MEGNDRLQQVQTHEHNQLDGIVTLQRSKPR
jgi:hypothetical protein